MARRAMAGRVFAGLTFRGNALHTNNIINSAPSGSVFNRIDAVIAGLSAIVTKRGTYYSNDQCHRLIELFGAKMVPMYHYEPDAATCRDPYYYHTGINQLFMKIIIKNYPQSGIIRAFWKPISHG